MFTKSRKKNFAKYAAIWVFIIAIYSGLLYVFVDYLHYWVVIVNPIVALFTFFIRYELFKMFDMVSKGTPLFPNHISKETK